MATILISILTVLVVLVALGMIGLVLIQQTKSGGGLGAMAGGTTESVFGANAGNVLTKITTTLAVLFFVLTLALAILTGHRGENRSVGDETVATAGEEANGDDMMADDDEMPPDSGAGGDQEGETGSAGTGGLGVPDEESETPVGETGEGEGGEVSDSSEPAREN